MGIRKTTPPRILSGRRAGSRELTGKTEPGRMKTHTDWRLVAPRRRLLTVY